MMYTQLCWIARANIIICTHINLLLLIYKYMYEYRLHMMTNILVNLQ